MLVKQPKILVVDDEQSLRGMLAIVLQREGYQVEEAENSGRALQKIAADKFSLVLSDIRMPDLDGLQLLARVKELDPELPVILMTAHVSAQDAVEAMKLGAEDYIIKPINIDELILIVARSLRRIGIEKEIVALKEKLQAFESIVGRNERMKKLFALIETVARTDSTILIAGESGTGKELIARAVHNKSRRRSRSFVSINCGALPENLLESELFGHKKGAFTDAFREKKGLLQDAEGGTVFLDEISEMSPSMQVKLLRVLQERSLRPVGSNEEIAIDIRVIAATNRDLAQLMEKGGFRTDLYYRLNVINVQVPPLRERKDDIPLLINHFMKIFSERFQKQVNGVEQSALELLLAYSWPGNVRELENCIERAVALETGSKITRHSLSEEIRFRSRLTEEKLFGDWREALRSGSFNLNRHIDRVSREVISQAMSFSEGNMKKAAAMLGISYRAIRYLVAKLGLK